MNLMKAIQVNVPGGEFELVTREIPEPIQIFAGQLIVGRRSVQGWRPTIGSDAGAARKDTMDFSLLTDVHPMIETFPLEQIDLAYEKMLNSKICFRAVLVPGKVLVE